jgi:hypothetical protein
MAAPPPPVVHPVRLALQVALQAQRAGVLLGLALTLV